MTEMKRAVRMLVPALLLVCAPPLRAAQETTPAENDPEAKIKIDFSYAGYQGGAALPFVKAVLLVKPSGRDDTALLQAALDAVGKLPVGKDGFRGALQLAPGVFHVLGALHLRTSGVVLRGAGQDLAGTTLVAEGQGRRALIKVGADSDADAGTATEVTEDAPAGSRVLSVATVTSLAVGDHVVVRRPSTDDWIAAMGMKDLPGTFANIRLDWKPGSHDLVWDRRVVAVDTAAKRVTLDAPITTALERKYGGGTLTRLSGDDVPERIGIEGLRLESSFDPSNRKDEEHSWIAIQLDHVADAWTREITARHFVSSAVRVNLRGRRITVESCRSEEPIGEDAGYRRQSFYVAGQQVLVDRCSSQGGRNSFASGLLAGGPNVFLNCESTDASGPSGAFEGWSSGVLYEDVHLGGARLEAVLDFDRAQGAGWTAANSVLWNDSALSIDALGPPRAENVAVASPHGLFAQQYLLRTGRRFAEDGPLGKKSAAHVAEFRAAEIPTVKLVEHKPRVVGIDDGRFVMDGRAIWGPSRTEAWWRGDTSPYTALQSTGSSVTRFMPGVTAPGETEDLQLMAERLVQDGALSIQINPGLWYDRRRDSHTLERRTDASVWAPFYEAPWARSGKGTAWDGLSLFDLTRFNPWYFEREKTFAEKAGEVGLLVFCDLYNTHNVLEIGPHWIDYAWRPANNINHTGLPEPPPLRVFGRMDVGNAFYDVHNPSLMALHRAYILHTLDVLGEEPNVVFGVAYQYAGPLAFEQFFQDTIHDWEVSHHRHVRVALTTSKQTTDAILNDPVRSKQIAVVDMRYWQYRPDGTLFAPEAGKDHAFRELIAKTFPGYTDTPPSTTPEEVYRQTREYRDRYPTIAFMPMESGAGPIPILMGGGASPSGLQSRPPAPAPSATQAASGMYPNPSHAPEGHAGVDLERELARFITEQLAKELPRMRPVDGWLKQGEQNWVLAGGTSDPVLVYSLRDEAIAWVKAPPSAAYDLLWFDAATGRTHAGGQRRIGAQTVVAKPDSNAWLLLLRPVVSSAKVD